MRDAPAEVLVNVWAGGPQADDEVDQNELDNEIEVDLDDRLGSIEVREESDELVLIRTERHGDRGSTEMLRFDRVQKLLRIFPMVTRSGQFDDQFERIRELQVEAPAWNRVFAAGDIVDYEGKVKLMSVGFGEAATAVNNAAVVIDPSAHVFPGHSTERD